MAFANLVNNLVGMINATIPVLIGVAVVVFMIGLARFILHTNDARGIEKGKMLMLWGIIGLFVMVSVWGIVTFIGSSLGIIQG